MYRTAEDMKGERERGGMTCSKGPQGGVEPAPALPGELPRRPINLIFHKKVKKKSAYIFLFKYVYMYASKPK